MGKGGTVEIELWMDPPPSIHYNMLIWMSLVLSMWELLNISCVDFILLWLFNQTIYILYRTFIFALSRPPSLYCILLQIYHQMASKTCINFMQPFHQQMVHWWFQLSMHTVSWLTGTANLTIQYKLHLPGFLGETLIDLINIYWCLYHVVSSWRQNNDIPNF